MAEHVWTFSDEFRPEVADGLAKMFDREAFNPGGFIHGALIGIVGTDLDGQPSYRFLTAGEGRLLEMMGCAEAMKLWVAREYEGGPIPNVADDDDED